MNALATAPARDVSTAVYLGLQALGFKHANQTAFYLGVRRPLTRFENGITLTVRFPKGAESVRKLVFEVEPQKYRNSISSLARLDVDTEKADWVEQVRAWLAVEMPKAKAHSEAENSRRIKAAELSAATRTAADKVRAELGAAGFIKFPTVWNDGEKICGARIEVFVPGATAEEISAKLLELLRQYPGN